MQKRKQKWLMYLICFCAAALGCLFFQPLKIEAQRQNIYFEAETRDDDDTEGEGGNLRVTVVEEMPAEEIEEASVPLAGAPGKRKQEMPVSVILMSGVLAGVLLYELYCMHYEKKLFSLRREVIAQELSYREKYRSETEAER